MESIIHRLRAKDSKSRGEALVDLVDALNKGSAPAEHLSELCALLASNIPDNNPKVCSTACAAVEALVGAAGDSLSSSGGGGGGGGGGAGAGAAETLLPPLVEALGNAKPAVRDKAGDALLSLLACLGAAGTYACAWAAAKSHKNWRVREGCLRLYATQAASLGAGAAVLPDMLQPAAAALGDGQADVRQAAAEALAALSKQIGSGRVLSRLTEAGVRPNLLRMVEEKCGAAAAAAAAAAAPSAGTAAAAAAASAPRSPVEAVAAAIQQQQTQQQRPGSAGGGGAGAGGGGGGRPPSSGGGARPGSRPTTAEAATAATTASAPPPPLSRARASSANQQQQQEDDEEEEAEWSEEELRAHPRVTSLCQLHCGPWWRPGLVGDIWADREVAPPSKPLRGCTTARELARHIDEIAGVCVNTTGDWKARSAALEKLRSLIAAGACSLEGAAPLLVRLRDPLAAQVQDLRSSVVKLAALAISELSAALGYTQWLEPLADSLVEVLCKQVYVSIAIVAASTHAAICSIVHNTRTGYHRLLGKLMAGARSRSPVLRARCGEYLLTAVRGWAPGVLDRNADELAATIAALIRDADPTARQCGRLTYWSFVALFPGRGDGILSQLDGNASRLLGEERDSALAFAVADAAHQPRPLRTMLPPPQTPMPAPAPTPATAGSTAGSSVGSSAGGLSSGAVATPGGLGGFRRSVGGSGSGSGTGGGAGGGAAAVAVAASAPPTVRPGSAGGFPNGGAGGGGGGAGGGGLRPGATLRPATAAAALPTAPAPAPPAPRDYTAAATATNTAAATSGTVFDLDAMYGFAEQYASQLTVRGAGAGGGRPATAPGAATTATATAAATAGRSGTLAGRTALWDGYTPQAYGGAQQEVGDNDDQYHDNGHDEEQEQEEAEAEEEEEEEDGGAAAWRQLSLPASAAHRTGPHRTSALVAAYLPSAAARMTLDVPPPAANAATTATAAAAAIRGGRGPVQPPAVPAPAPAPAPAATAAPAAAAQARRISSGTVGMPGSPQRKSGGTGASATPGSPGGSGGGGAAAAAAAAAAVSAQQQAAMVAAAAGRFMGSAGNPSPSGVSDAKGMRDRCADLLNSGVRCKALDPRSIVRSYGERLPGAVMIPPASIPPAHASMAAAAASSGASSPSAAAPSSLSYPPLAADVAAEPVRALMAAVGDTRFPFPRALLAYLQHSHEHAVVDALALLSSLLDTHADAGMLQSCGLLQAAAWMGNAASPILTAAVHATGGYAAPRTVTAVPVYARALLAGLPASALDSAAADGGGGGGGGGSTAIPIDKQASDAFKAVFAAMLAATSAHSDAQSRAARRAVACMRRAYAATTIASLALATLSADPSPRTQMACLHLLRDLLNDPGTVVYLFAEGRLLRLLHKAGDMLLTSRAVTDSGSGSGLAGGYGGGFGGGLGASGSGGLPAHLKARDPSNPASPYYQLPQLLYVILLPLTAMNMGAVVAALQSLSPDARRLLCAAYDGSSGASSSASGISSLTEAVNKAKAGAGTAQALAAVATAARASASAAVTTSAAAAPAPAPAYPAERFTTPAPAPAPAPVSIGGSGPFVIPLTRANLELVLDTLASPDPTKQLRALHYFGRAVDLPQGAPPPTITPGGVAIPAVHRDDAVWMSLFDRVLHSLLACLRVPSPADTAAATAAATTAASPSAVPVPDAFTMLQTSLSVLRKLYRHATGYVAGKTGSVFAALFTLLADAAAAAAASSSSSSSHGQVGQQQAGAGREVITVVERTLEECADKLPPDLALTHLVTVLCDSPNDMLPVVGTALRCLTRLVCRPATPPGLLLEEMAKGRLMEGVRRVFLSTCTDVRRLVVSFLVALNSLLAPHPGAFARYAAAYLTVAQQKLVQVYIDKDGDA